MYHSLQDLEYKESVWTRLFEDTVPEDDLPIIMGITIFNQH